MSHLGIAKRPAKTRIPDTPRDYHVAHPTYSAFARKLAISDEAKYARLRTLHGLGCPPRARPTPLHPKCGSYGRLLCPTGMSKNLALLAKEHGYNTISPRSNQARRGLEYPHLWERLSNPWRASRVFRGLLRSKELWLR